MNELWSILFTGGYGTPINADALVAIPYTIGIIWGACGIIRYYVSGGVHTPDWKMRKDARRARRGH